MSEGLHVSDFVLDDVVAGATARAHVPHLLECERCSARLATFELQQRQLAPDVSRLIRAASVRRRTSSRSRWVLGFVSATLASTLVVAFLSSQERDVLIKGTASVELFVKRGDDVFGSHEIETFEPGDALRFVVTTHEPGYLFLVDVQSDSAPTALYPYGAQQGAHAAPGEDRLSGFSLVLDDSPEDEYFVLLFTKEPVTLRKVERRTRWDADGEVPAIKIRGGQTWFVVKKRR